jgi:hypothetical protein
MGAVVSDRAENGHGAVTQHVQAGEGVLDAAEGVLRCDVWYVGGDFPTLIDCCLAPGDIAEPTVASAVAVRPGTDVLLPWPRSGTPPDRAPARRATLVSCHD